MCAFIRSQEKRSSPDCEILRTQQHLTQESRDKSGERVMLPSHEKAASSARKASRQTGKAASRPQNRNAPPVA